VEVPWLKNFPFIFGERMRSVVRLAALRRRESVELPSLGVVGFQNSV
jgi:hypothetical protein